MLSPHDFHFLMHSLMEVKFIRNKTLGGFHLARQNIMGLTGLGLMRIVISGSDYQAMTGNKGYFEL